MILDYPNKKTEQEIIDGIETGHLTSDKGDILEFNKNILIEGDNLTALKTLIFEYGFKEKIDLIYIDPPFATNNTFTIDANDRVSTISNSLDGSIAYSDKLKGSEFIEFIRERLVLLKMLLSPQGSIYLHIDYKIGHYVKLVMDEVFGIENFRNDITRVKCNPKNFNRKGYGNMKDLILFYSKSSDMIWHEPKTGYTEEDVEKLFKKVDEQGRRYTTIPLHAPGETKSGNSSKEWKGQLPPKGRHWRTSTDILTEWEEQGLIEWSKNGVPRKKIFSEEREGKRVQDIWEFKDPQYPNYPTEKNSDLLDLIVKTSSNDDSIVLDCFCGSGTTLLAAQKSGRRWIGIDQSPQAIKATIKKVSNIQNSIFNNTQFERFTLKEQKEVETI